ncbi:MAG: hypothetical protein ACFFDF_15920 [Candidatus Odinarchaeota archaeon]
MILPHKESKYLKNVEDNSGRKTFSDEEWEELKNIIISLSGFCKKYSIEEEPVIDPQKGIYFSSFLGMIRLKSGKILEIGYNENKIDENEYNLLIKDVAKWVGMLGSPFLKSFLEVLLPFGLENELSLSFSELLIGMTEEILFGFIPPRIERRKISSIRAEGRILFPQTILNFTKGIFLIVSKKIQLDHENLPFLFLINFHLHIYKDLLEYRSNTVNNTELNDRNINNHFIKTIDNNLKYHSYILSLFWNQTIQEKIFEIDFRENKIISKIDKISSFYPTFKKLIILWESYLRGDILKIKIEEVLCGGSTFKPISKLYEFWCLELILKTLKEILGEYSFELREKLLKFTFKEKENGSDIFVEVFFNPPLIKDINPFFNKIREILKRNLSAGRPDIYICFSNADKKINIVLEVKYKRLGNINLADFQRLLSYIINYSSIIEKNLLDGILFYLPNDSNDKVQISEGIITNLRLYFCPIKPNNSENTEIFLKNYFRSIINTFKL